MSQGAGVSALRLIGARLEGLTHFGTDFSAAPLILRVALGSVIGAMIGSFLATILMRWPAGASVASGRSRCDACGTQLRWQDLVPVLSWLMAVGRCRHCGAGIDKKHPAMELSAALISAVAFALQPGPEGLLTALFGLWLLILAALDLEEQWLPDLLTLPLIPLGLLSALAGPGAELEERALGAAAGFFSLLLIAAIYRRLRGRVGLGGGDPKLLAGIGAWLGWQPLPLVLAGAGLLGLASLLLTRARGGSVNAADRLPLGTLMALTAWPLWLIASTA